MQVICDYGTKDRSHRLLVSVLQKLSKTFIISKSAHNVQNNSRLLFVGRRLFIFLKRRKENYFPYHFLIYYCINVQPYPSIQILI